MTKTIQRKSKKETAVAESHLIEAVVLLMEIFESPLYFLDFLNQALYWHDVSGDQEGTYPIQLMIRYIVRPWIEEKEADARIKKIQSGIHALADYTGFENFNKCFSSVTKGFAKDFTDSTPFDEKYLFEESCCPPPGEIKHPFLFFHCMHKFGGILEAYERIKFPGNVYNNLNN